MKTSPVKSIPGLVTLTDTGVTVHAQTVRWANDVYEVPDLEIPVEFTTAAAYRVVLTKDGLVLAEALDYEDFEPIPGGTATLCSFALAQPGDTPANARFKQVFSVECTTEMPESAEHHSVPAVVIRPERSPAAVARLEKRQRATAAAAAVKGKPVASMTLDELKDLVSVLAERAGLT